MRSDYNQTTYQLAGNSRKEEGMVKLKSILVLCILLLANGAQANEDPIVTTVVDGTFREISRNIRAAIIGKGIHIAHTLSASDMLRRTGPAYGYHNDVYADAEIFEFCSADISHKLARRHPDNIVLCPFTISVYTLIGEPGKVRISYRIPTGRPGTEPEINEILELIKGILDDATW
jgi:hypothetical protein